MEIIGAQPESKISPIIKNELGIKNFENINKLGDAFKTESEKRQIELHLLLVGGMVKPEKRGKKHKDVDLVLYSPQLASENFPKGDCPKFKTFASFVGDVAKELGWEIKIEEPWFIDYEYSGDGKVILYPDGEPVEVLPVRQDKLLNSFEDYQKAERDPYITVF
ncbi:MAG: hypothetical protein PHE32_00410 [Candidatus Shapirobacteria bacterium]|nr:hypothetical protein [Candidatus Shapirobacteria bacterium]MDD4410159.1 hypothetical protein [Candidatus Shapirobacteria bacterium]